MTDSKPQLPTDAEGCHLLLYDGVCGLCSLLVQFVLVRDRRRVFRFASLQSPTGRGAVELSGSSPDDLTTLYVFANYRTPGASRFTRGRAALFVARSLPWPWRAVGLFGFLPTAVLDWLYDLVARNRYRVFGRRDQCLTPLPEYRSRFVDF